MPQPSAAKEALKDTKGKLPTTQEIKPKTRKELLDELSFLLNKSKEDLGKLKGMLESLNEIESNLKTNKK